MFIFLSIWIASIHGEDVCPASEKNTHAGKKFSINEFVEVQISSRKKPHQRGIDGMLGRLAPGDGLIVKSL
jgi:hypothetical protein